MARKKPKHNLKITNEDKVLKFAIIGVVLLFLIAALILVIRLIHPAADTSEGAEKLAQMDEIEVSDVESELTALEESEAKEKEERANRSNEEKFKDTLIIGDFIAQGLYEQGVIEEAYVLGKETSCVHDPDGTEVTEHINEAIEANPKVIFLELGINDTIADGSSAETFAQEYKTILENLKSSLPNTQIYVNSILPVSDEAEQEEPGYANVSSYNKELKALCKEEKVVYIDNTGLVQDEYYKGDGKHMTKDYFTVWADYMADIAEL